MISCRSYSEPDRDQLRNILLIYWYEVNGKYLGKEITVDTAQGSVNLTEIEARMYSLFAEGLKFQLCFKGREIIGFMMYHLAYESVLIIEGMYFLKSHLHSGLGKKLIASISKPIKKLLFQTHTDNVPESLFRVLKKAKELHKKDDLITWECDWGD